MAIPTLICATNAVTNGALAQKNTLDGEIQSEAFRMPKNTDKGLSLIILGLGSLITIGSSGQIIYGISSNDSKSLNDGIVGIQYGIGNVLWMFANYLNRINFEPPPPKPKKVPLAERIKEKIKSWIPRPMPIPVPIRN